MYTIDAISLNRVESKQQEAVPLLTISSTSFSGSHCKRSSGWWAPWLPFLCISVVLLPLAHFHATTIKLIPLFSGHQKNSSDGLAKLFTMTQTALERTAEDWKLLLSKRKFKYFISICLHSRPEIASEWKGTTAKPHTYMLVKHVTIACQWLPCQHHATTSVFYITYKGDILRSSTGRQNQTHLLFAMLDFFD